jgi:hypothetical protein
MRFRASLCACLFALSACTATAPPEKPSTSAEPQKPLPAAQPEKPAAPVESAMSLDDLLSGGRADAASLPGLIAEAQLHPLGSRENPVRVNMPVGERAYLARLRCSDGAAPSFEREGSAGPGVFGSIVDIYDVRCRDAEPRESEIWMDMYHPEHRETAAPPEFTIVSE